VKVLTVVAAAALAVVLFPDRAVAQARKLNPIEKPKEGRAATGELPPLPSPGVCQQFVQRAVRAWGKPELTDILDPSFPNRGELLDAIARATVRASNLELRLESIENTRYTPWQQAGNGIATDCIADVRTRVTFDDPATGQRTVRNPSRSEWRVRFVYARRTTP
jgi:hypothetical protein